MTNHEAPEWGIVWGKMAKQNYYKGFINILQLTCIAFQKDSKRASHQGNVFLRQAFIIVFSPHNPRAGRSSSQHDA